MVNRSLDIKGLKMPILLVVLLRRKGLKPIKRRKQRTPFDKKVTAVKVFMNSNMNIQIYFGND